jgi:hypothetical protein
MPPAVSRADFPLFEVVFLAMRVTTEPRAPTAVMMAVCHPVDAALPDIAMSVMIAAEVPCRHVTTPDESIRMSIADVDLHFQGGVPSFA